MADWKKQLFFFCFITMMAALFISRAVLSIAIILFVASAFMQTGIKKQARAFFTTPILWGMSLLFVLPLVSGLWSEDKNEWLVVLRLKLPLLLLPVAFATPFTFTGNQWKWVAFLFIAFVTAATLGSLFHYMQDIDAINASYLRAKAIRTSLNNDHVRFSWLVSITVLLAAYQAWQMRRHRWVAIILAMVSLWLIVFLHLLAARTGLISFYIMVLAAACWLIVSKARPVFGAALLLALVLLPLMAYWLFPSFQNRFRYISYEYGYAGKLHYLPGGNDAARMISLRAGWNLLRKNPLGIGAGDIRTSVNAWDRAQYPGILPADILYPSSEWLIYGLTAGWPGVLLFTIIMLIPCFVRARNRLVWLLLNCTSIFSFLFDMGLEVQFGIFIYSFVVLWWWKWLKPQKKIPLMND